MIVAPESWAAAEVPYAARSTSIVLVDKSTFVTCISSSSINTMNGTGGKTLAWGTLNVASVVLSAQATDAGVNKATPALFALADTPEKMVALGEDRVRDLIKTIGLFRTKAKNVAAMCRMLIEHHGGKVPQEERTNIERAVSDLKEALKTDDPRT